MTRFRHPMNHRFTARLVGAGVALTMVLGPARGQAQGDTTRPASSPYMAQELATYTVELLRGWGDDALVDAMGVEEGMLSKLPEKNPYDPAVEEWFNTLRAERLEMVNRYRTVLAERGLVPSTPSGTPPAAGAGTGGGATPGAGGAATGGGRATTGAVGGGADAAGGRGTTTQPVGPARPAGDTQPMSSRPGSTSSMSTYLATGTVLMLTAGEMAHCATEGISLADCASGFALKMAAGLAGTAVVGGLVTVIAPGAAGAAAVVATGIAIASSAGSMFIALEQAGARMDQMAQQRANAARVDARQMQLIVDAIRQQGSETRIDQSPVTEAVSNLNQTVDQARRSFDTFRTHNAVSRRASAMCADLRRQPAALAAAADQRLTAMSAASAAIVKAVSDAARLVTPCSGAENAQRAKDGYAAAQRDLQSLQRQADDALDAVRSALSYYPTVKDARAASRAAAEAVTQIQKAQSTMSEARARVRQAAADYAMAAKAPRRNLGNLFVTLQNLRNAFPEHPPAHIASGLEAIDSVYVDERGRVLSDERLNAIAADADDQVSRVDGFLRLARTEYDNLAACAQAGDDMPDALKQDLSRISSGINEAFTRANQAVAGGKDIPARADQCLKTTGQAGEGRLTGACQGTIEVTPASGPVGSPLRVIVVIDPPGDQLITRVVADNPGCTAPACRELRMIRPGQWSLTLSLQAPASTTPAGGVLGTFRVSVSAFGDGRAMCSGQSKIVTVTAR